ncbi:CBS domain-containing protein [Micromonospora sp. A3M-1-15]|uniref:CBS domain-containing protein n=1 Tax=Micromonospora sp. A3M-1-15 TaxID=2962035 RepID=UPI0020B8A6F5|nr:CBS domain-containing protein [Micromonospora sp. A3M-1-15]MCP3785113.1 CBS domain-containing protein [Micromonospora sp. A3M-1-15]
MSPRAACRLEALGFTDVYDYAAGKVDWLAHNLPIGGASASAPTVGSRLRHDVPTAGPEEALSAVRARVDASPYRFAVVVAGDRTLLGRLRHAALDAAPGTTAQEVMESGPSTLRPHLALAGAESHLRAHHLTYAIITDPGGHLLGTVHREDLTGVTGDDRHSRRSGGQSSRVDK